MNRRQNPLKGIVDEELDKSFQCIVDFFDEKWLSRPSGYHPLQRLWNRSDTLSTSELFSFGSNLLAISKMDGKWAKEQVKIIKTNQNLRNVQGAFFEINGLASLVSNSQMVKPSKANQPGYDGTLIFPDKKEIRLSLKNYGASVPREEFDINSNKFQDHFKKLLGQKRINWIQVVIHFVSDCPSKKDWKLLQNNFSDILDSFLNDRPFSIIGNWHIVLGNLRDSIEELHPDYNSYTLIISCQYHKNEFKNLTDKLEEACFNLSQHSPNQNQSQINGIFVHLPVTASVNDCKQWVEGYFQEFPTKPISLIMFYQPTYVKDIEKRVSFIQHTFTYVTRGEFSAWNNPSKQISLTMPVGVGSNQSSKDTLIIVSNEQVTQVPIDGHYFFQRGEHFYEQIIKADGSIEGFVDLVAPGILRHTVFKPFPDQEFVLEGRFQKDDKLLIL